jgi:hypothetical protein
MDFLKVPGGILRADEVERVLRKVNLPDHFELCRYERDVPDGLRIEVVLHVEAAPEADLSALALSIAKELRVSAAYTYEHGVRDGLYLPLRCERMTNAPKGRKRLRIMQC